MSVNKKSLSDILSALKKPFLFASKDDFSRLNSVKGLAELVDALTKEAEGLKLSTKEKKEILRLKELFVAFDSHNEKKKEDCVKQGLTIIEGFEIRTEVPATKVASKTRTKREEAAPTVPSGAELLLKKPLKELKGIGEKLSLRFEKKGLSTVEDMLYFLPIRYEDRQNILSIRELQPGENQVASGEIIASGPARYGRKRVFEAALSDGTGILMLKWFNFRLPYMEKLYKNGKRLVVYGTVGAFGAKKDMVHPNVEFLDADTKSADAGAASTDEAPGIVPIYSEIEGLHQKTVRKHVKNVVKEFAHFAEAGAPKELLEKRGLLLLSDALIEAHKLSKESEGEEGRERLARKSIVFDELFSLELGLALKKRNVSLESGIALKSGGVLVEKFLGQLPFKLTGAQERALGEISLDMAKRHPMNRLIQGDVGSGKTVIALVAALRAVECGYQAAIMAPTEILAEQHFLSVKDYMEPLGVKCLLLTGSLKAAERRAALEAISSGEVGLIIGTHALIQKDVEFKNLALAVVDEQHRFGVIQRAELMKRGAGGVAPDVLVMTATPIPRTLAMTVFGDMDVSIIDELPPGRTPIETSVLREKERGRAYNIIRKEVAAGGQAYIVYPLVEESEELSLKDATNMEEHLSADIFPDLKLALLHGRMKGAEKEAVMESFKTGKVDILVATTVIEVGVDVPNASIMVVEHAERFGLSQLHQLRGRVGRGKRESKCILLAQWTQSDDALKRLRVMERTTDGFEIAEEDLNIRGPGDFIGTRQSGLPDFRLKETLSDLSLLKAAREEAEIFLASDPELKTPDGALALKVLKGRWAGRLELAEVG